MSLGPESKFIQNTVLALIGMTIHLEVSLPPQRKKKQKIIDPSAFGSRLWILHRFNTLQRAAKTNKRAALQALKRKKR